MKFFYDIVGKFFYSGNLKYMPGTYASILAAFIWFYIPSSIYVRIVLILLIIVIGYISIIQLLKNSNNADPSYIVIDEVVGMWISCLFINQEISSILIALLLFRYLDILKPSFIYHLQSIKGPLGILLDDIICGMLVSLIVSFYFI